MSMSIYTKKGTKTISVSSLSVPAMSEIMGIPTNNSDLIAYGKLVLDTLHTALPGAKIETVAYDMKKPTGELVSKAVLTIKADADWEEVKDDFPNGI